MTTYFYLKNNSKESVEAQMTSHHLWFNGSVLQEGFESCYNYTLPILSLFQNLSETV